MTLNIKNASIHNLQNFSVEIPHNSFVCVTGVSGSGKSSLVYDIIEKEANKRFFESFSVYARQFLKKTGVVNAEISGIRPVISIKQKTLINNLRSTAGTLSGFSDLLRLLMARCGKSSDKDLKLSKGLFSFNNPLGQCPYCKGIGEEEFIDEKLLIADKNRTLRERALKITLKDGYTIYSQVTIDVLEKVCNSEGFNIDIPFHNLDKRMKQVLFYGSDKLKIPFGKHTLESRMKWKGITVKPRDEGFYKGIIPVMSEILKRDRNPNILKFCSSKTCTHCNGSGLKPEVLGVIFENKNFVELTRKTFKELDSFFSSINSKNNIANEIISALIKKCRILHDLGLDYLTPDRKLNSLSGGESQRLRISTVLDNEISGIMYIFDEPSIGLHEINNIKLIKVLKKLVSKGNTVIVVEHNKETILASDYLIDIGPMAGYRGGKLLYSGKTSNFNAKNSITYQALYSNRTGLLFESSEKMKQSLRTIQSSRMVEEGLQFVSCKYSNRTGLLFESSEKMKQSIQKQFVYFEGIKYHNLKNINVKFETNSLNVVTGVSGAGKSSLIDGIIVNYFKKNKIENFDNVSDYKFENVVYIGAKQPGKNSRSNVVTYTGIFDDIRKLFASLSDSLPSSSFSFNTGSGRCIECLGKGETEITMHFLKNIKVICNSCNGKRFNDVVLKIKYKNKNISEVLELEISEALDFFKDEPKILKKLDILNKLGLDYLKLGQPTSTFSGGEAKRLKLSAYLDSKVTNNLIVLDEPTNGLSIYDTKILLKNLVDIVKSGNTIIAIEHDSFFISSADFIIDLGPGSGDLGGHVLYEGNFRGLLDCKKSLTAQIFNIKDNYLPSKMNFSNEIIITGVSTNDLKNINCKIQKNAITLIKGGEGAGKTSLCIGTIFNEANSLYLSSLSAYSRQFIGNSKKGKFKSIKNILPAISLTREKNRANRITFGQVSGLYDLYRLLYSRFSVSKVSLPSHNKNNSLFSFMHISGACQHCSGRGFTEEIDIEKLAIFELSIENKALNNSKPGKFFADLNGQYMAILYTVMCFVALDYVVLVYYNQIYNYYA